MSKLDSTRLRELLEYNPDTGVFTSLVKRAHTPIGKTLGTRHIEGYVWMGIEGSSYLAHRLAWLYMTGAWPPAGIDHRNGNRADNRWENLRPATSAENAQNQSRPQKNNPYLGVCWEPSCNKWKARIRVNGVEKYLGVFATAEEARDAYLAAKKEIHPFANTERKA